MTGSENLTEIPGSQRLAGYAALLSIEALAWTAGRALAEPVAPTKED